MREKLLNQGFLLQAGQSQLPQPFLTVAAPSLWSPWCLLWTRSYSTTSFLCCVSHLGREILSFGTCKKVLRPSHLKSHMPKVVCLKQPATFLGFGLRSCYSVPEMSNMEWEKQLREESGCRKETAAITGTLCYYPQPPFYPRNNFVFDSNLWNSLMMC